MYDDEVQAPFSLGAGDRYYKVAKFPTRNIKTPIVMLYGGKDSLVDINIMLKELPKHTKAKPVPHFEHLDFLWAEHVEKLVFPHIFAALDEHASKEYKRGRQTRHIPFESGRLALAQLSSNSEGDISSFAGEDAREHSPERTRRLNKKRNNSTARKHQSRLTAVSSSSWNESLAHTNPTSISLRNESPAAVTKTTSTLSTDTLPNPGSSSQLKCSQLTYNSEKERYRSGSGSSTRSSDVSAKFDKGVSALVQAKQSLEALA